jgi:thymidine kinase
MNNNARLEIIFGPMFSSKTTLLLQKMSSLSVICNHVLYVKSNKDTRAGDDSIMTHEGRKINATSVDNLMSLKGSLQYERAEAIGIDEGEFFTDLVEFCISAYMEMGKYVIVAGLDSDYKQQKFGEMWDLIPYATSVTKCVAFCKICKDGSIAQFSKRIKSPNVSSEQLVIGGADKYEAVCRLHLEDNKEAD